MHMHMSCVFYAVLGSYLSQRLDSKAVLMLSFDCAMLAAKEKSLLYRLARQLVFDMAVAVSRLTAGAVHALGSLEAHKDSP